MTVPSFHVEAKKIAYRQSRDGLVVSFVIHPNDMPDELAVAPLGQRYMLALAAIGDDEKPILPGNNGTKMAQKSPAITASERGKQRYAAASDMGKARLRSVLLAKDARFIAWIGPCREGKEDIEAAQYIRNVCCAGESRKLIAEDETCYRAFIAMETQYLVDTNQMAEPR